MEDKARDRTPLMTPQAAAEYLGLQRCTLDRWRSTGGKLPFYKVGGRIFYKRPDLDAFIEAGRRNSTTK